MQPNIQQLQEQIGKLQAQLNDLTAQVNKNNFSAYQAFTKASDFQTSLKVPVFTTLPTCEVGQVCAYNGKLMICSAKDTWTIAGTQS